MGRKFGMGFFWWLMLVQGVLGVLLEALGIFLGFDFCPHSIIPVTSLKSSVPQLRQKPEWLRVMILVFSMLTMCGFFVLFFYTYMYSTDFSGCIFCAGLCVCGCTIIFINFIYLLFFLILLLVCMPRQISWCFFPSLCHLLINTWSLL